MPLLEAWPSFAERQGTEWEAFKAHVLTCEDTCEELVPGIMMLCPKGQQLKDLWWTGGLT